MQRAQINGEQKMKNKKLGIALLTLAVFTSTQANNPRTPGEAVTAAPAVILNGAADILSFGHAKQLQEYGDRNQQDPANVSPTVGEGLLAPVTGIIDAPFGQTGKESYIKKTDSKQTNKHRVKKEKSCKKSCDSKTQTPKKTRTKKTKDNDGHPAEAVVLPVTVAADVVTLGTQHFTARAVDSINGDSDTERTAE